MCVKKRREGDSGAGRGDGGGWVCRLNGEPVRPRGRREIRGGDETMTSKEGEAGSGFGRGERW